MGISAWHRRFRSLPFPGLVVMLAFAVAVPLLGCDNLFGLDRVSLPPPSDTTVDPPPGKDNTYTCECRCTYGDGGQSLTPLSVCAPPALNPNLVGGATPTAQQLMDDCTDRVAVQVQRMSNRCYAPNPTCVCSTADPLPETLYDASCDQACVAMEVANDCSNWDPRNGVKTANCGGVALCVDPGPVCLKQGVDPPTPTPLPLAGGIMGQMSRCLVTDGTVRVSAGDHEDEVPMAGVVNFAPALAGSCSEAGMCVSMDYKLDTTETIHFDGFLGFGDTDIANVVTAGASLPFVVPAGGVAFVAADSTQTSGRGRENGTHRALFGSNAERLVVSFDGDTCGIQGNLLGGGVGDPDADNEDVEVHVNVTGVVENTPPVASLGPDRRVECTSPEGADVLLDASPSTDGEGNIVSFGWYRGTRAGDALGSGSTITVAQALGQETYFVKAIDEYMQADEAAAVITVADGVAPTIECNLPATIVPRRTPYSFTATASDVCDDGLAAPTITGYECFAINKAGKRVARKCSVIVSGDTFTILDSGGIGDYFRWSVDATDADGNGSTVPCETTVVRPGPGPA